MPDIKIRFNTMFETAPDTDLKWRVLVDGRELLAREVRINVPSFTTHDLLPGGIEKWHISCSGVVKNDGNDRITIDRN